MKALLLAGAMLMGLNSFATANVGECGLSGSIEQRIQSCSAHKLQNSIENMALVTATEHNQSLILLDKKTNLMWLYSALPVLHSDLETLCNGTLEHSAMVLNDMKSYSVGEGSWRLPTPQEAQDTDLVKAISKSYMAIWTSEVRAMGSAVTLATYADGKFVEFGATATTDRTGFARSVCVKEIK